MHRRRFLELAGRLGAGFGVTRPLLSPALSQPLLNSEGIRVNSGRRSGSGIQSGSTSVILLDGEWSICTDPHNSGRDQNWFRTPRPDSKITRVPAIIQETYPNYHGVAWYWREFTPEANPYVAGRYLLRFNAVDYLADVWLNGAYLGSHELGRTPFVLDATSAMRPGESNIIAVRVLNPDDERIDNIVLDETPHSNKVVHFVNGSQYDFGGILESVELILTPVARITDLYLRPDWKTGRLRIATTVHDDSSKASHARLHFAVTRAGLSQALVTDRIEVELTSGDTQIPHEIEIKNHQLWDLKSPCLYRLTACIEAAGMDGSHEVSANFGFRDFRIGNGYFRLNDQRILVRSTHTGNCTPFSQILPPPGYPDMLLRDLFNAKTSGFNTVRFISGPAHPYQLDLCDELGLLIYQESSASWLLKNSSQMKARYENAVREMILRDRNHPSVVIWGMLNETQDGPVFREAESDLQLVRSLDETRLVLLSSGRFDGDLNIGSASNPGGSEWEPTWGKEAPGAGHVAMLYPSGPGSGDFHFYPSVPQTPEVDRMMRTLSEDSKPVFLSEYGIGSMMDVIHDARMYEQAGIRTDAADYVLMRSMADRLTEDWSRFKMDAAYPYPETLLRMSQLHMARHRLLGFNLIRSNPKICGFNLTGMLDHAMTGEGVWRFWRDWKPGAFDAMQDGWAPVRWCLFVEPTHTYIGRPLTLEAVLANEDTVRPGKYPAQFRVWGPNGIAWERQAVVSIPSVAPGQDGPLAVPVLKEDVVLTGSGGTYELIPYIEKGIAPPETSWQFHLTDPASLPSINQKVATWNVPKNVESWLTSRGITIIPLQDAPHAHRALILVGDVSKNPASAKEWRELAARIATGSTVIFLSPQAFRRGDQSAMWLPQANKGRIYEFYDFLYHKECVAKPHPVFEGLQGNGILDWYYYGPMLPHYLFDGQNAPSEVIAAAFATGYSTPGGYASGVLLGSYKLGAGKFFINSFPVLDHVDQHPVADRLLLNLITHNAEFTTGPAIALPADFQSQMKEIGYVD